MNEPETLIDAVRYYADRKTCFETMLSVKWPDGKIVCPNPETRVNGMAAMSYPDPNENDDFAPRLFHWKMSAKKAKIIKDEIDSVLNEVAVS